jgi:phage shock protein A
VRRFEASAELVEARIRAKRREGLVSPGGKAGTGSRSPQTAVERQARLAALDAEIEGYQAALTRLQKLGEQEQALGDEWEKRAMLAVQAGDDSLAREALDHRRNHVRLATAYQSEVKVGEAVIAELRAVAGALRA